ncbi:hypothetical protein VTJ04DRAFT_1058 [Mycothermus thermophilus]|uniref:uncharacterized protein n=1 Tax=Humicola insolens TaxID=85995 RepID=UPI003743A13F
MLKSIMPKPTLSSINPAKEPVERLRNIAMPFQPFNPPNAHEASAKQPATAVSHYVEEPSLPRLTLSLTLSLSSLSLYGYVECTLRICAS